MAKVTYDYDLIVIGSGPADRWPPNLLREQASA